MKGLKGWHNRLRKDCFHRKKSIKQKELESGQSSWLMLSRAQCFKAGGRGLLTEALCPRDRGRLLMPLTTPELPPGFHLAGMFYTTHLTSTWFERKFPQLSAQPELAGGKLNSWGNCQGRVYLKWEEGSEINWQPRCAKGFYSNTTSCQSH